MQNQARSTEYGIRNTLHAPHSTLHASKFGPYGGQFVPETLMPALAELEAAYSCLGRLTPHSRPSWTICCAPMSAGPPR